jgi:hypothetical protein
MKVRSGYPLGLEGVKHTYSQKANPVKKFNGLIYPLAIPSDSITLKITIIKKAARVRPTELFPGTYPSFHMGS